MDERELESKLRKSGSQRQRNDVLLAVDSYQGLGIFIQRETTVRDVGRRLTGRRASDEF